MERDKEQRIDSRVRVIGFVLGIAIAASIVTESRIPAGAGVLGADAQSSSRPAASSRSSRPASCWRGPA